MSTEDDLLSAALSKWEAAYRARYALSPTAVTEVTATLADALGEARKTNTGDTAEVINLALQKAQQKAAQLARQEYKERKKKRQERQQTSKSRSAPLGAPIGDRLKR